ncbi:MAG: hypothetical protein J5785_01495 [Spirochaetales bacterium]|nr:hypothetical protein [Spirochaetales bacterium]
MKSKKTIALIAVCIVLVFAVQNLGAKTFLPAPGQNLFSVEEVYYMNSALVSCDMLQFLQVYFNEEDPLAFFLEAENWTDEEIEEYAYYYFNFTFPEIAGRIPFYYFSNIEQYIAATGQSIGEGPFSLNENITTFSDLADIYPSGIIYCNPYDMLRTAARQLKYYVALKSPDGRSPSYDTAKMYLDYIFAAYEAEFDQAMAEEAAYQQEVAETTAETNAAQ